MANANECEECNAATSTRRSASTVGLLAIIAGELRALRITNERNLALTEGAMALGQKKMNEMLEGLASGFGDLDPLGKGSRKTDA